MPIHSHLSNHSSPLRKNVKCLQISLHHSKLASLSLAQVVLNFDIDIAMIQESYAFTATTPVVANIPPGYSIYHNLTRDHAYGSAILVRDSLAKAYKLTTKHFDNHVSCIELKTHSGTYRFASVYLSRSIADPELSLNTIHSFICLLSRC